MAEMPSTPVLPSHAAILDDLVSEQQKSLLSVLQPLSDRLGDAITWQQTALGNVTGDLKSALKQMTGRQQKALQHVADQTVDQLHQRIAEQEVRLQPVLAMNAAPPPPPPLKCPAGTHLVWNGVGWWCVPDAPAGGPPPPVPPPIPPPVPPPTVPASGGECCPPANITIDVPSCPIPDTQNGLPKGSSSKCDQCVKCDDIKDLPGYKVYQIPVDKLAAEDAYIESDCGNAYWHDKAADIESAGSIADTLSLQQWSAIDQDAQIALEQFQEAYESDIAGSLQALMDQQDSILYQQQF